MVLVKNHSSVFKVYNISVSNYLKIIPLFKKVYQNLCIIVFESRCRTCNSPLCNQSLRNVFDNILNGEGKALLLDLK